MCCYHAQEMPLSLGDDCANWWETAGISFVTMNCSIIKSVIVTKTEVLSVENISTITKHKNCHRICRISERKLGGKLLSLDITNL